MRPSPFGTSLAVFSVAAGNDDLLPGLPPAGSATSPLAAFVGYPVITRAVRPESSTSGAPTRSLSVPTSRSVTDRAGRWRVRRAIRRQPEVSRGEILDAALACFSERGYHGTSVDDIAARAGLSKGAIYWHFAGKRELFLALVDRFSERRAAGARGGRRRAGLAGRAARGVRARAAAARGGLPFFKLALEYIAQSARDDDIRARAERAHGVWKAAVEKQIARGVADGNAAAGRRAPTWGS